MRFIHISIFNHVQMSIYLQIERERRCEDERKESVRNAFRKNSLVISKSVAEKQCLRVGQESDVTCLIYDVVTRVLYNLLIALSARR